MERTNNMPDDSGAETIEAGDLVRIKPDAPVRGLSAKHLRDIGAIGIVLLNFNGNTAGVLQYADFADRRFPQGVMTFQFETEYFELVDINKMTDVECEFPFPPYQPADELAALRSELAAMTEREAIAARLCEVQKAELELLRAAIQEAIHIFDRDDGAGQSAWNMRAVLQGALRGKQP